MKECRMHLIRKYAIFLLPGSDLMHASDGKESANNYNFKNYVSLNLFVNILVNFLRHHFTIKIKFKTEFENGF